MPGRTPNHSTIAVILVSELSRGLEAGACRVFNSDLKVHIQATGLYTYPDASSVCGKLELQDQDVLLNPVLLAEILSDSTRNYDRGDKFLDYRSIASFRDHLIIEQRSILIEQYCLVDGRWTMATFKDPEHEIKLQSVPASFSVGRVYRNIASRQKLDRLRYAFAGLSKLNIQLMPN